MVKTIVENANAERGTFFVVNEGMLSLLICSVFFVCFVLFYYLYFVLLSVLCFNT